MNFAAVFSGLRRENGYSQRQVASDLNISQALLSHYENGVREPRLEFIERACAYYGVTADALLGITPPATETPPQKDDPVSLAITAARASVEESAGVWIETYRAAETALLLADLGAPLSPSERMTLELAALTARQALMRAGTRGNEEENARMAAYCQELASRAAAIFSERNV